MNFSITKSTPCTVTYVVHSVRYLLKDEHGVVEELLQLLVGVVDAQLLEGVQLEDFETEKIKLYLLQRSAK